MNVIINILANKYLRKYTNGFIRRDVAALKKECDENNVRYCDVIFRIEQLQYYNK